MTGEREKCSDILDLSSQISEDLLNAGIKNTRNKLAPEQHPLFDGVNCVEEACRVPIPKVRLDMGRIRCVDCQQLVEQRARQG